MSIFDCFSDRNAVYDLETNTLGVTLELIEACTADPFVTVEVPVFDFDEIGFNMNSYEGADNAPIIGLRMAA